MKEVNTNLSPCAFCDNQSVELKNSSLGAVVVRKCLGTVFEPLEPGSDCSFRIPRPLVNGKRSVPIEWNL